VEPNHGSQRLFGPLKGLISPASASAKYKQPKSSSSDLPIDLGPKAVILTTDLYLGSGHDFAAMAAAYSV
jgi:hypothetical protein